MPLLATAQSVATRAFDVAKRTVIGTLNDLTRFDSIL